MPKPECPDEDLAPLAREVRRLRRGTGLSVRDFAAVAGFGRHTSYSYYEGKTFTSRDIRTEPWKKIAIGFLKLGVKPELVAKLGPLPAEFDATKAELALLREGLEALRGEVAEIKSPRRRSAANG